MILYARTHANLDAAPTRLPAISMFALRVQEAVCV